MAFDNHCTFSDSLNAHKRVRYSHGLVLGVGELKTEQHYLLAQHYGHQRRLHGYGTGAGLALEIVHHADGPECRVHPGWAVDPHGRDICVHEMQCARLNDWLLREQQRGDLSSPLDVSGTTGMEAYVVLCYRECETDQVPLPVGPCLSLDRAMVPSRIQQAFDLRLTLEAPPQAEEDAMRRLGDVLSRVSISPGGLTTPAELVAEIEALVTAPGSTPSVPADLVLDPIFAEEILRTALRVFVTKVRPELVPDGGACLNGPRDETCLLLGKLIFDITVDLAGPKVVPGSVVIDESRRPLLFSMRWLQEALLSSLLPGAAGNSSAPPFVTVPAMAGGSPATRSGTAALSTSLVTLRPDAASLSGGAANADFFGIPSIRFRPDGGATFLFSLPPGLATGASARLRLQWGFTRARPTPNVEVAWEASLKFQGPEDDLRSPAPVELVTLPSSTDLAQEDRVLATALTTLPAAASLRPTLGILSVSLRSTASVPNPLQIHLIVADIELSLGGQP